MGRLLIGVLILGFILAFILMRAGCFDVAPKTLTVSVALDAPAAVRAKIILHRSWESVKDSTLHDDYAAWSGEFDLPRPPDGERLELRAEVAGADARAYRILPADHQPIADGAAINFKIEGTNKVMLLGYAYQPTTKDGAERVVQRIEEVEEVENQIEVLPNSGNDDQIRMETYAAIYGHPAMRRYVPGAGFSNRDIENLLRDLRFGLQAAQITRGPHNIHIVVKNGNVALIGVVTSDMHKQIAEHMARGVPGSFAVENYLQVVKSS